MSASLDIGLQELASEAIYRWVLAQSVCAGGYVRLRVTVVVASGEGFLFQQIPPVPPKR